MKTIQAILKEHGPSRASLISKELEKNGLKAATARKRIERVNPPVRGLPLRLPHNERFLYIEEQQDTEEFWEKLINAFEESGSHYGHVFHSLAARGGCVPHFHFGCISGSPSRLKKHQNHERVLERLSDVGLLSVGELPSLGRCVLFSQGFSYKDFDKKPLSSIRARLLAENILLTKLKDWGRELGLMAYGDVRTRVDGNCPDFANFMWDLTAPSYVSPLCSWSSQGKNPGFIVADVALCKFDLRSMEYFVQKQNIILNNRRNRPFLAFLVANGFSNDAFNKAKNLGILATTPGNLFGKEIGEALMLLVNTLTNAAAAAVKNPNVVDKLFDSLGKIEGAALNLRGPLFELLVGHCVKEVEGNNIEIRKEITVPNGKSAEIDVFREKGRQGLCAYECKGKAGGEIKPDEVKKWLGQVSVINSWIRDQPRFAGIKPGFELWTTGSFSRDAEEMLFKKRKSTKKYRIAWKDGEGVLGYARNLKTPWIIKTLNEHFLKHPMATV